MLDLCFFQKISCRDPCSVVVNREILISLWSKSSQIKIRQIEDLNVPHPIKTNDHFHKDYCVIPHWPAVGSDGQSSCLSSSPRAHLLGVCKIQT